MRAYTTAEDIFIAKLNTNGTLIWNTFLGGSGIDSYGSTALKRNGNLLVSGRSDATWGSPKKPYIGSVDIDVAELDKNGNIVWHTFVGGSSNDWNYGIATDVDDNIYLSGYCDATWGTPIWPYNSGLDISVIKLNSSGTLLWSTFLGGSGNDSAYGIILADNGNLYINGLSYATWGSPVRVYS